VNRTFSIGLLLITLFCSVSLISCGGGSAAGSLPPSPAPPPPPPAGDFSLVVEAASVTIQQGGALQFQTIQGNLLNGFTGTISLTLSGLPTGVTATPPGPFSLSVLGQSQTVFQLAASTSATTGSSTVTVTGTSGAITHSVTFSLAVTLIAPFSIHVSPTALSLTPGTNATVQISLTANPGTSPQLFVTISGPPNSAGVNVGSPGALLTLTNPVSFPINPTIQAQPLQNFPLVITAGDSVVNATNTSVFTLPLTVSVPFTSNATPTRSTFVRTDQGPTGMAYDQFRKLVFVSVEILNEIQVLSSVDGHLVTSIPVGFPAGIDEAADGSAVYVVSPFFGGVTIIDPNLLQVVGQSSVPKSVSGLDQSVTFFQLAALSTGQVLLYPSLGFVDLVKPPFYLWDPKTDTFTRHGQASLNSSIGLISRSADHTKVLAYAGPVGGGILYDATTDTFNGPNNSIGAISAISPDGSRIVSVTPDNASTTLLDSNFNVLGSLQLGIFPVTGVVYSLDGKHIYVFGGQTGVSGNIAAVIDAQTFSVVGLVPSFSFGTSLPFSGQWITTFAIDESSMLFGAAFRGVGFLDMSAPTFLQQPLPGSFSVQPRSASLFSPTQAQLNGAGFSQDLALNLFLGAPPASPSALKATNISVQSTNVLNLTITKGTTAGPANATLTRSDGFFEVMPDAVTFGPTILRVDADAGSLSGNDSIWINGYGLNSSNTQVTIGGRSATIVQTHGGVFSPIFPTDSILVKTPPGTPGKTDVTITTPDGSTSISGGFHYLNSVQVYPIVGALDALTYDQNRQRLYVSNEDHNRIEMFDLAASKFLSPVPVGNAPTALALTPDGSLLAVVNRADGTVSVVDPVKMQVSATYPVLTAADNDKLGCGGVVVGISPAAPHRMLVDVQCTSALFGGTFHLVDLDTGSVVHPAKTGHLN
jgi:DNA-binding beta-propeller fold protein YncE